MFYTHVAAAVLAGAIAATGAWQVQNWRHGEQIGALKLGHATVLADIAEKTRIAADKVRVLGVTLADAEAASDAKHTKELTDAKAENDRYRACVRNGTCGVRVIAKPAACPAGGAVPQDASPGSLGDGALALDREAAERVLDLRQSISDDAAKLGYLQEYAKQCERAGVEAVKHVNAGS